MPVGRADLIIVDRKFVVKNAEDVLYKYKASIIDALRQNLIEADKDTPGKLIQSIDVHVFEKENKLTFELEMEDYWKYVDEGRRKGAKMPPQEAMLEFIKARGISAKLSARKTKQIKGVRNKQIKKAVKQISKEKALKQVAFLIGRGIKKHGIKPTHFYSSVVNDDLKLRLTNDLAKALGKDIEIDIKTSFDKLK